MAKAHHNRKTIGEGQLACAGHHNRRLALGHYRVGDVDELPRPIPMVRDTRIRAPYTAHNRFFLVLWPRHRK